MQGLSSKQKLLLTVVGVILIFGLILFIVVKPLLADLGTLHNEVQGQKDELNLLILEEASYKTASADLARIEDRVEEIRDLFPVKEQLAVFVERLEFIARDLENDFSITITDAEEQNTSSGSGDSEVYTIVPRLANVEVIPFDFQLSGSFLGIVQFLQTLENQPFFSEIDSFVLRSDLSEGSGDQDLQSRSGRVEAVIRSAFYASDK
ncbi:MAG: hypothetical protein A2826_02190 [Candidatus Doudnabacteria bacterium RIFCSPHIGHO2_01_FULL_43_23]|uniref:Pilus assembly protein PilO n=1 Tax=Candidatus Doudnabacteria bacterium RIFCSPHIGHO2_01_FULL_43_23 TaxID=1817822 RepID=A0A1F5NUQ2_9BACT|nr:MAG: hypothetical protein A2826_02190 [Candidatus Doudnabacteria bacterium RIFCSPHIGHO2_01_FULL_43_23]